jgi:hypothetical protein
MIGFGAAVGAAAPVESWTSPSWVKGSPLLRVMSRR